MSGSVYGRLLPLTAMLLIGGCNFLAQAPVYLERRDIFEPDLMAQSFQRMSELFPSRVIARGGPVVPLEEQLRDIDALRWEPGDTGEEVAFEEFWRSNHTAGLVVLHRGALVFERYDLGADAATHFTSWSVAKSVVSTLVGLAIADGYIRSLDDPLERYLPSVTSTAYEGVTLRQALQMSSGVAFSEDYDGGSDVRTFMRDTLFTNRKRANPMALGFERRDLPGTVFNYSTAETQMLGWVVSEAAGLTLSEYLQRSIWNRLGMEHDAFWLLDQQGLGGVELAGCCLSMALRDQARLGQLFLQRGRWQGEQVLPEGWVDEATQPVASHLVWRDDDPWIEQGYQYQWWAIGQRGAYAAEGVHGQFIYVDPARELVIAMASAWPVAWDEDLAADVFIAFDAIGRALEPAR